MYIHIYTYTRKGYVIVGIKFRDILTIVHGGTQLLFCCASKQASKRSKLGGGKRRGAEVTYGGVRHQNSSVRPYVRRSWSLQHVRQHIYILYIFWTRWHKVERVPRNTRRSHMWIYECIRCIHVFPLCQHLTTHPLQNTYGQRQGNTSHHSLRDDDHHLCWSSARCNYIYVNVSLVDVRL